MYGYVRELTVNMNKDAAFMQVEGVMPILSCTWVNIWFELQVRSVYSNRL